MLKYLNEVKVVRRRWAFDRAELERLMVERIKKDGPFSAPGDSAFTFDWDSDEFGDEQPQCLVEIDT